MKEADGEFYELGSRGGAMANISASFLRYPLLVIRKR